MNPQYEILAECLLPTHMLEWFELTNVEVKPFKNTFSAFPIEVYIYVWEHRTFWI